MQLATLITLYLCLAVAFYAGFISDLVSAMTSIIDIIEKLLFIGLGVKALNQGTITVPVVDKLVRKYMD